MMLKTLDDDIYEYDEDIFEKDSDDAEYKNDDVIEKFARHCLPLLSLHIILRWIEKTFNRYADAGTS